MVDRWSRSGGLAVTARHYRDSSDSGSGFDPLSVTSLKRSLSTQMLDDESIDVVVLCRHDQFIARRATECLEIGDRSRVGRKNFKCGADRHVLERLLCLQYRQRTVQTFRVKHLAGHFVVRLLKKLDVMPDRMKQIGVRLVSIGPAVLFRNVYSKISSQKKTRMPFAGRSGLLGARHVRPCCMARSQTQALPLSSRPCDGSRAGRRSGPPASKDRRERGRRGSSDRRPRPTGRKLP